MPFYLFTLSLPPPCSLEADAIILDHKTKAKKSHKMESGFWSGSLQVTESKRVPQDQLNLSGSKWEYTDIAG